MASLPKEIDASRARLHIAPSPPREPFEQDAAAVKQTAMAGEVTLARLAADAGAQSVALARLDRAGRFTVVASMGLPLLPVDVTLPAETASVIHQVVDRRSACILFARAAQPLDTIAANLGLRFGIGLPVVSENAAVIGVVAFGWSDDICTTVVEETVVADHERRALCGMLAATGRSTVVVCHEEWLLAAGLARTVERSIGATADISTSVPSAATLMAGNPPDLVVCSDRIAIREGLTEAMRQLRIASDGAPLLVVTRCSNAESLELARRAGAAGYLPLDLADKHLAEYSSRLLDGETALPTAPPSRVEAHLTTREHEVLGCFERGLYDKQIAHELGVALSTVKTHARGIYAKLGVGSRTAALHRARAYGLI